MSLDTETSNDQLVNIQSNNQSLTYFQDCVVSSLLGTILHSFNNHNSHYLGHSG